MEEQSTIAAEQGSFHALSFNMVGRNQYGYITPAFSGAPWWGKINLQRSGCGANEQKKWDKR